MDPILAFIIGMALVGFLWLGRTALSVWERSLVAPGDRDPELNKVRVALSRFDPEQILAKLDELDAAVKKSPTDEKLVPIYDRMNLLSKDVMTLKAEVVTMKTRSGVRSLLGGKQNPEVVDG